MSREHENAAKLFREIGALPGLTLRRIRIRRLVDIDFEEKPPAAPPPQEEVCECQLCCDGEHPGDCRECAGWGSCDGEHCQHCDGIGDCPECNGERHPVPQEEE